MGLQRVRRGGPAAYAPRSLVMVRSALLRVRASRARSIDMGTPGEDVRRRGTELRSVTARRWFGQHYTSTRSLIGMDGLIAVTGATGAPRLAGAEVRGASSSAPADQMRAALEGVATLFLVPAEESTDARRPAPDRHRRGRRGRRAAGSSTCRSSNAAPDATFTLARDHWATEQHIRAAGVAFTFPRMSLYLDFIPRMAGADGTIAGPAGEAARRRDARRRRRRRRGPAGVRRARRRAYDVTGPEALTLGEIAATLAADPASRSLTRTRRSPRRGRRARTTARPIGRSRPGSAPTPGSRPVSWRRCPTPSSGSPAIRRRRWRSSCGRHPHALDHVLAR